MLQRRSRESIQRDSASYSEVCPKALWALSRDVHDAIVERSLLAVYCPWRQAKNGQKRALDFAIHQSTERAKLSAFPFLSLAGS